MEMAFYILLVSWVILLATCIVAISRFKKANDSLDTSLDTVIELTNQLDAANQDLDYWKDSCDKNQKTIDILNERIHKMSTAKEDNSILYVDKAYIEYVTSVTHVNNQLIKDITDGNLRADQVEVSLRNNIEHEITRYLLSYAKYYASYDIEYNSYNFAVRIPVVAENNPDWECYKHSQTPLTNILLDKVKED